MTKQEEIQLLEAQISLNEMLGPKGRTTSAAQVDAVAPSSAVTMRKLLLNRRESRLVAQESLLATWSNFFPQHDPITLRFIGEKSKAESYWNGPSWKKAA